MYCGTDSDPNDSNGLPSPEPSIVDEDWIPTSDEEDDSMDGPTITGDRIGERWNEDVGEYEIYVKSADSLNTTPEQSQMTGNKRFEFYLDGIITAYEAEFKHQEHWTDGQFWEQELAPEGDLGSRWALRESATGSIVFDASTNKYYEADGKIEYVTVSVDAESSDTIAETFVLDD